MTNATARATTDLCDVDDDLIPCDAPLRQFGGRRSFEGTIATVRCFEDNVLVRQTLSEAGDRRVLVIDGGGSLRRALVGDQIAALALSNGWAGIVVNGAVRDAAELGHLDIGVVALGTCPRRSRKDGGGALEVSVAWGGSDFRPGDTVVVDDDGIVVLRAE